MDEMQTCSMILYNNYLNDEEQNIIEILKDEFNNKGKKYDLHELWKYDSFLGGIGCYSMPADPKKNPFAGGYVRYLFRPLQYVRCSMEIVDLNYTARDVIRDTGLYLEFVMKYLMRRNSIIKSIVNHKGTLGKLSYSLYGMKVITEEQFNFLKLIIELYNWSKHNINMDNQREMSFSPLDAIVFYIATRKLSMELLRSYYTEIYRDFGDRLQYFYVNYKYERDFGYVE